MSSTIKNYLSLVKFSHTLFAMPFALLSFFLAARTFSFQIDWWLLLPVVVCMVTARNAAMAFNRYADVNYDKLNPRTAVREIPAGIIAPSNALFFVILNVILFIISAAFINRLCFYLSPVALLVVLGYSYTKRFTFLCHFVLGIGLALAPVGAYIAVTSHFALAPICLGLVVLFWVSGFDIIYALQDEHFDKQHTLHSIPTLMGTKNALMLSNVLHALAAILLFAFINLVQPGWLFYSGGVIFVLLLFYQHSLVKVDDLSKVNLAFFTTNGIASLTFCTLAIIDLWFI
ncbi:MAG: UbiA family prenyltransferase [Bacteroidetes bacterium]|nr:UbiA family prenyltransferase [Bacteroidota bacterium]